MKDILIIAQYSQAPNESGNNRFHYIATMLSGVETRVEVVTTDFSHDTKLHRHVSTDMKLSVRYKYTMLHEPGYVKNVSIARLISHDALARQLEKYLRERSVPNVIYCAVPSLEVARVAAEYAKRMRIRFIIDIQDLWPEAFMMLFPFKQISRLLFMPVSSKANYVYRAADAIIAVSDTYVCRAKSVNTKYKTAMSVYIGIDLKAFDHMAVTAMPTLNLNNGAIWLVYIGTLGHSYDLPLMFDALRIVLQKYNDPVSLLVMGDGPLMGKFYTAAHGLPVCFTGRLSLPEMIANLTRCDIALNPIIPSAEPSIINKHGDYAAAGLPVINTQRNAEYCTILTEYHAGITVLEHDPIAVAEVIHSLIDDTNTRKAMGEGSRKMAEERFDRNVTYPALINLITQDEG